MKRYVWVWMRDNELLTMLAGSPAPRVPHYCETTIAFDLETNAWVPGPDADFRILVRAQSDAGIIDGISRYRTQYRQHHAKTKRTEP